MSTLSSSFLKTLIVDKKHFKDRLNDALNQAGFPPINRGRIQRLADIMDLSHRGAGKWLDGETVPPLKKFYALADKLQVDMIWLATGKGNGKRIKKKPMSTPSEKNVEAPLYKHFCDEENADDTPVQTFTCYEKTIGAPFSWKVTTDTLLPSLPEGSILILDPKKIPAEGDFVLVKNHLAEVQCGRFLLKNHVRYLESSNPLVESSLLKKSDKILGVAVQAIYFFHNNG